MDNNRCGTLPFVFDDDFGFDRYVEYALDVPMYFVYRCVHVQSQLAPLWCALLRVCSNDFFAGNCKALRMYSRMYIKRWRC